MKNIKKLLFVLLALTLCFAAFSCGGGGDDTCTSHTDSDKDGICDTCKEEIPDEAPEDVILIEGGEANFQIVMGSNVSTDNRMMIEKDIVRELKNEYDIVVDCVKEGASSDKEQDIEVLIGYVENRGEDYAYDYHELGEKGYMIKIVGTKVLVTAGSDDALADVLEEFMEDILGMGEEDEIIDVTMTADMQINKPQTGYKVTSLAVNGTDMKGYTIATDTADACYSNAAKALQATLYTRTGYWLEIVTPDKATDKSIVIKHIDRVYGNQSFDITATGSQLVISCAFDNKLIDTISAFTTEYIIGGKDDIDFKGDVYNKDISVVYYEEFGAKGNGSADDFEAIYNAHVFANECGQTVKAGENKRYYIHYSWVGEDKKIVTIPIMTNVDWGNAEFIIDDSDLDYNDRTVRDMTTNPIFTVTSNYEQITWDATDEKYADIIAALGNVGASYGTKKLDLGLGYPAMVILYNDQHEVYRRYGSTYAARGNVGDPQQELILLDAEGNIDGSTPFMFDYTNISSIVIIRDDVESLTVTGGTITTRACHVDALDNETGSYFSYYLRGILVNRSHTTVDGVKHYVTGEVTNEEQGRNIEGVHYRGFLYGEVANEVTFKNCVVTGRRYYGVSGTYDIGGKLVNKIKFENVVQSNFWIDSNGNASAENTGISSMSYDTIVMSDGITENKSVRHCWGVGGTNYCKNMDYIGCTLSRFDAHCGLYNGSVIDTNINFFAITGKGDFIVRDVNWYSASSSATDNSLIYMRNDYGSVWNGTVELTNVTAHMTDGAPFYLFYHQYSNWDFGYQCAFPSLDMTGFKVKINKGNGVYVDAPTTGYEIQFVTKSKWDTYMHLEETKSTVPIDVVITGYTPNEENPDNPIPVYGLGQVSEYNGVQLGTYTNLNPIKPPEYISIIDNENNYVFVIPQDDDLQNGFLSGTKFIYGSGENDYFLGTNHADQTSTSTYKFK